MAIHEKALGPNHPDVATIGTLAVLYDPQGRYADAESLYKRALAIREKALGPDHPDVATNLDNLATLYKRKAATPTPSRCPNARWQSTRRRSVPTIPTSRSLNNLALLYLDQGRYADAEPLIKRALAISEKALGPDHPGLATDLNNLAGLYHVQGRYADAERKPSTTFATKSSQSGPSARSSNP